jgi:hypothetical protein
MAPVIVIWDNLNTHVSAMMREFTGTHPDLADRHPPPLSSRGLNPVEGVRANMTNGPTTSPPRRRSPSRHRQKPAQTRPYQPALIGGLPAWTGLSVEP